MKTSVLIAVLFAACAAQTQNLKVISLRVPPNGQTPIAIQFLCSQSYDRAECVKDATALRQAMSSYPTRLLGTWSFVLVPADDWKNLVRSLGGDPVSPAFSLIDQHTTVMDQSLFSGSANRTKDFLRVYRLSGQPLLDLAVTHEMGHGICQEKDERRADDYGKELREGKTPDCSKTPGHKQLTVAQNPR